MFKYLLLWFPMPLLAILNAVIRELLFLKNFGQKTSHQLSTFTLIIFLSIYIYLVLSVWSFRSSTEALLTGIMWCLLTLVFEFGLGLAGRRSMQEMLKAYDLVSGELWILVPFFMLVSPLIFYHFLQK